MPDRRGPEQATATGDVGPAPQMTRSPAYRWYHKIWAVVLVTFCLEIGLFLAIFPWTQYWHANYFAALLPGWQRYWDNDYLRGAVSGLGALNLYIALMEILQLGRFVRRQ